PLEGGGYLNKAALVAAYEQMVANGSMQADTALLERIRMKPMRTLSGVTTVTVLTKPYPCPGKCIFCPTDVRMPKSYLPDEPGAQRALQNEFDPYRQVRSRLLSYEANGHPTDKIELLILGGTWSVYRHDYQEWFVKRCLDALNETDSADLAEAQRRNETAPHRNVGLVIETRPDEITPEELRWLRHLGVTKVQMGVQSLDDRILALNRRGHTVAETLRAAALLRAAGFKIVMHWMPNLLGATPESDRVDFARLWTDFCPDEIKIYPTQLLENTELYAYWQRGEYEPYSTQTLIDLIADLKPTIPEYCRVNRVVRDIPSTYVVAGNRRTSLRQDVLAELARRGQQCRCIRCREVRDRPVSPDHLIFKDLTYRAAYAEEHFLHFVTPDDRLAGYLRLSLPLPEAPRLPFADLAGAALIREVHVYGQSLPVGVEQRGAAQHIGLGTQLLQAAEALARAHGFRRLAVISAIGTRQYYEQRGFARGEYYMVRSLAQG
uniref:elongator complex protein 3 n=1 Tax=uncultured Thermanaerothrix sp. TaxID=1195149 RepID=UPI00260971D4